MDIEDLSSPQSAAQAAPRYSSSISDMDIGKIESILREINEIEYTNRKQYQKIIKRMNKKYHSAFSKNKLNRVYTSMIERGELDENLSLLRYMRRKSCRSHSGVIVITVFMLTSKIYIIMY